MADIMQEMQHQVMGYDRAATLFSPDGRLLQVEYAEKTVRLGTASIGIVCEDGVVIVADRRMVDELMTKDGVWKINIIDDHIIACGAGIMSDARVLLEKAQLIAQQHKVTYDETIEVELLVREIANIKQAYAQYAGVRPFGVELMFGGVNKNKKTLLFVTDVTGNYFSYKATAIGENDEKIKEMLKKYYKENMKIEEGIRTALTIFKKIQGKNFDISRFEAAFIKKEERKVTRIEGKKLSKYLR